MRLRAPVTVVTVAGGTVTAVHLGALLVGAEILGNLTQVLLMVFVALWLWLRTTPDRDASGRRGRRPRLVELTLVALVFSWLGDSVPRLLDGDAAFLTMVGFFLVAQVVYVAAFWPTRRRSAAVRARWSLPVYAAALVAIVAACAGEAGVLLPAVVVYASMLATMSILAWGVGPVAGVGGVIFLISDAMIALGAFAPTFAPPQKDFLVMVTYVAAQVLIAFAVDRHAQGGAAVRDAARTATPDVVGRG
ncbi:lysoplasmalogenase family protein [Flavimobilis rhizosphaerae]|nr:lysoplasmalogenase family protein [Flavimobilis rhizosphaerae]